MKTLISIKNFLREKFPKEKVLVLLIDDFDKTWSVSVMYDNSDDTDYVEAMKKSDMLDFYIRQYGIKNLTVTLPRGWNKQQGNIKEYAERLSGKSVVIIKEREEKGNFQTFIVGKDGEQKVL